MWHLTNLALRSRLATILLAVVAAGVSIWALTGLKVELIPDISFPYTTVVTVYPQATPDTVVDEVTAPIERVIWDEWSGSSLKHVTSTSSAGISIIMAEFEYGTDMTAVGKKLDEEVGKLTLPPAVANFAQLMGSSAKNPQIIPINMNILPLVNLSLSGNLSPEQLKQIADTKIAPQLATIKGVLRVDTEGGDRDQVVISPDPDKMNRYGISVAQIAGLLGNGNSSLSDIQNTSLGVNGAKLSDIASVSKGPPPLSSITRTNGLPSVGISVVKTESANTVLTAKAINAKLEELKGQLGDGVKVTTIFDQSNFINSSISQLWEKAVVGGLLAILVVFVFLWAVRASLVTAISIPLSLFIGFLCMRLAGITLNILTLMAMALAVGRLIDDSIVMVEIIYRRMRQGEDFKAAAIGGAREVANPITTATLATVAIFIPLMFVGGIVGQMFVPFALTVTFAMLASLLVALTIIPALSRLLASAKPKAIALRDNWYQRFYTKALRWTLGHRVTVVVAAVVLLFGSMGLLSRTGTSFMSGSMGEATITIGITLPPGGDISATSAATAKVEALLSTDSSIRSFRSSIGAAGTSMAGIMNASQGGGGSNTATITVYLKSDADLDRQIAVIDQACQGIVQDGLVTVGSGSGGGMGGGLSSSSLNLSIQGQDQKDIANVTAQLLENLQDVKGIADLKSDLTTVVPKLNITIDPARVATAGLPPAQMAQLQQEFVLLMNGGTLPGKAVTIDGEIFPIYIKAVAPGLSGAEQAKNLKIGFPQSVALGSIADVSVLALPSHVSHTDTALSATITGTITEKNVGAVNRNVQKTVDALPAHPGVTIVTSGIAEEMASTFSRMLVAILIAIAIVLVIVVLMMRSIVNPLIIMVSLPLAFIGSVPALLVSGHTLGVSALMGLLMLVGIVLTNAIVLVSMVEQQRKNGLTIKDALLEGGRVRLRPILMTALTTILAMVPMALSVSSGTVLSAELAIVVIGGMVSSTFLTLFVIPAVYSLVHRPAKQSGA